ncbi:MAG TPA: SDR family oxidoreductase [Gemmatimonadales bacterium]|nr:SDR family oxidoreductase [Gemmatimonadales bacterium]
MSRRDELVLLTGATGYVGGRLRRALEADGRRLRCMARRPDYLRTRVASGTEVVAGDILDVGSLEDALRGVHTAYYLVHSMGTTRDYERNDKEGAALFAHAARRAGVRRIIYLGGLGEGERLSRHLASRQEVGRILRESGIPTLEFRASIVIGSGSLSFELVRALVEKLPAMVTPSWVDTPTQPIGIEDLVAYLLAALDIPKEESIVYEIGGPDRVSYGDLMREYARLRGLERTMISVPVLTPRVSSLWLALVTPVYAQVGRELIDGVRNATVVRDKSALYDFRIRPRGIREVLARALVNEDLGFAATRWSDALSSLPGPRTWGGERFGSRRVDSRAAWVAAPPDEAFRPIMRIGGDTGWYYGNGLWRLRGLLDLALGGPGLRRGRGDPELVTPGDAIDFWRVEAVEPGRLLRLAAEMRLPGRAWLQFEVTPARGGSLIRQTALFDPVGLRGLIYWYALWGIHQMVFAGMLRNIVRVAGGDRRGGTAEPGYSENGTSTTSPSRATTVSGKIARASASSSGASRV